MIYQDMGYACVVCAVVVTSSYQAVSSFLDDQACCAEAENMESKTR